VTAERLNPRISVSDNTGIRPMRTYGEKHGLPYRGITPAPATVVRVQHSGHRVAMRTGTMPRTLASGFRLPLACAFREARKNITNAASADI